MTGGVSRGGFSEFSNQLVRARGHHNRGVSHPSDVEYFSRLARALGADHCENTPLRWGTTEAAI